MDQPCDVVHSLDFAYNTLREIHVLCGKEIDGCENLIKNITETINDAYNDKAKLQIFYETIASLKFLRTKLNCISRYHDHAMRDVRGRLEELRLPLQHFTSVQGEKRSCHNN